MPALCATARKIADGSIGAVAVSHDWSGEVDGDFDRIIKTFSGFAANPNNYATLFITIGTPGELLIIDLAKKVIQRTNSNSKIIFKSFSDNFGEEFEEAKSRVPSISKINSAIGWKNQMTIDEIIDEIVSSNSV